MSDDDINLKKRRILRFIRDLDLRYIRGSIDRRTYQTLKNKYKEILSSLPSGLASQDEVSMQDSKQILPEVEIDIQEIESGEIIQAAPTEIETDIQFPEMELEEIPPVEIEELKIRYVMHMAIKAATRTFEEEMELEQEYVTNKIDDQEYMKKKNEVEAKQHKVFQHFYKLSELLFSVNVEHLYKNTHNNFLLFNNELSENINRLRRMTTDKKELKGIIYDINERVIRHRPILKKAAQDTLKWKVIIQQEREKFRLFKDNNQDRISQSQKDDADRSIRQLEIYEELLDDDINDYSKDLDAMDQIYGEHLKYQEIITPYFKDLSLKTEVRIQRYSEIISSRQLKQRLAVATSASSREIDYQLLSELKALWRYSGKPVIDEQSDLVGFVVGPGQFNEEFGIIVKQQREISLSMIRRIFDHIVSPTGKEAELESELEKKEFLLNELPKTIPQMTFTYLVPDAVIEYCRRIESPLTKELKDVITQTEHYLFFPNSSVEKTAREIKIDSQKVIKNGDILPFFNPTESNVISSRITESEEITVRNIFNQRIGKAHSVIYHPMKGYFLVVEKKYIALDLYKQIYDILHEEEEIGPMFTSEITITEKRDNIIKEFSEEYNRNEEDIQEIDMLKRILSEKNTGILPDSVENSKFILYSLGNVRIVGNSIQISFGATSFELNEVFDLEGKVVENVKGTEIGVVYNLQLKEKPVLYLWTSIDLLLIASFINSKPASLFENDQNFIDNLAISIGKQLSIAPQVALRPDIVMTFMNLIGKINNLDEMQATMEKFNPKSIELGRIISVDKRKILADISDKEIMEDIYTDIEVGETDDEKRFVTSPDYYLREQ
ncbi:MAG: hypothetical protein GOP50_09035 [Candidatus Heimdallarchaeota archaeon]|nr:hypothetical protein [Candidatus Heimdallarchaeota archaeon]